MKHSRSGTIALLLLASRAASASECHELLYTERAELLGVVQVAAAQVDGPVTVVAKGAEAEAAVGWMRVREPGLDLVEAWALPRAPKCGVLLQKRPRGKWLVRVSGACTTAVMQSNATVGAPSSPCGARGDGGASGPDARNGRVAPSTLPPLRSESDLGYVVTLDIGYGEYRMTEARRALDEAPGRDAELPGSGIEVGIGAGHRFHQHVSAGVAVHRLFDRYAWETWQACPDSTACVEGWTYHDETFPTWSLSGTASVHPFRRLPLRATVSAGFAWAEWTSSRAPALELAVAADIHVPPHGPGLVIPVELGTRHLVLDDAEFTGVFLSAGIGVRGLR